MLASRLSRSRIMSDSFRCIALSAEPFAPLFGLDDSSLAARGARRCTADGTGHPCRLTLEDAAPGERVLLVHYQHVPGPSPYRAGGPVFVRERAQPAVFDEGIVPPALRRRLLSVRAYDADDLILDADVVEGTELERLAARLLAQPDVAYLHAHYARYGCYAARIERAYEYGPGRSDAIAVPG